MDEMDEIQLSRWIECEAAIQTEHPEVTRIIVTPDFMTQREADIATRALRHLTGSDVAVIHGRFTCGPGV